MRRAPSVFHITRCALYEYFRITIYLYAILNVSIIPNIIIVMYENDSYDLICKKKKKNSETKIQLYYINREYPQNV